MKIFWVIATSVKVLKVYSCVYSNPPKFPIKIPGVASLMLNKDKCSSVMKDRLNGFHTLRMLRKIDLCIVRGNSYEVNDYSPLPLSSVCPK